jgi:hypothetical protein
MLDLQLSFYRPLCYNSRTHCPLLQCLCTTSATLAGAHTYFMVSSFKCEGKDNWYDLIPNPHGSPSSLMVPPPLSWFPLLSRGSSSSLSWFPLLSLIEDITLDVGKEIALPFISNSCSLFIPIFIMSCFCIFFFHVVHSNLI